MSLPVPVTNPSGMQREKLCFPRECAITVTVSLPSLLIWVQPHYISLKVIWFRYHIIYVTFSSCVEKPFNSLISASTELHILITD